MQSLRVVDKLEKDGQGLNLTWEVRNGIVTCLKTSLVITKENFVYKVNEKYAYRYIDIPQASSPQTELTDLHTKKY